MYWVDFTSCRLNLKLCLSIHMVCMHPVGIRGAYKQQLYLISGQQGGQFNKWFQHQMKILHYHGCITKDFYLR